MATTTRPDLEVLYAILRTVASRHALITYGDLSQSYLAATGVWFEPRGSWDDPLGDLNDRLDRQGLPPLSAVVVLSETREPGGGFWKCPSVGKRPPGKDERSQRWSGLVKQVHGARWPAALPRSEEVAPEVTMSQLLAAHDQQWVLLLDPKTDPSLRVLGGRLACHAEDRDEVYRKAKELNPQHSAILFIGERTGDYAVNL
jgi:hypothetical protein